MSRTLKRSDNAVPGKGLAMVTFANDNGWTALAITADVFNGTGPIALPVSQFIAHRGTEVVTMTWVDGAAIGPIGWHVDGQMAYPVEDRADMKRTLAAGG